MGAGCVNQGRCRQLRPGGALLRMFRRSEAGVAAVEFAFILPILVLVLSGIMQFGAIMFVQNTMVSVADDVARRVAVGELSEATAAQAARDRLIDWGITYTIVVQDGDPADPSNRDVDVTITAPLAEAAVFDVFGLLDSRNLAASVTSRKE